ncbi:hypothetical protein FE249_18120 (plasmid) [Acidiphilium multivorum]|uniref:hypothetical protein n=1 Tax=Acidiphilium TaxID=522 RepID=UPI00157A3A24|nr:MULTISPECIES: hypothetical protein [Acidiphilium]UNC16172.1 hypothetical protein FE249_18120 [Acidiphilium multivorum]
MTNARDNTAPAQQEDSQFAVLTRWEHVPAERLWSLFCRDLLARLTGAAPAASRPRRVLDDGTEPRGRM